MKEITKTSMVMTAIFVMETMTVAALSQMLMMIKLTVISCDMKTRNNWIYTYNMDYHQGCSHCAPFLQIPTTFQLPPFLAPLIGSIATSRFSFGEATLSAKMR